MSIASPRPGVARASAIVMAGFVAAKVVGLVRERVIAGQFGASSELDAYVAAFRIPDLLFTLFAGGAVVTAFLPLFAEARRESGLDAAWRLANQVTNLALTATGLLAIVAAVAAPSFIPHLVPEFTADQQLAVVSLTRLVLVSTVIFAVSGLQLGMLNACHEFVLPSFAVVLYNVGIVAGALFLAPRFGIYGLAYGVVLGALLHLAVKLPWLRRHGYRWQPRLDLRDPQLRHVLALWWPRMLALGTVQLVWLVNVRLASGISAGSLAAFNFAWVLSQMPQTVLGTAVGTAVFPTLAELSSDETRHAFTDTLVRTLRSLIFLTLPAAALLALLARPVVGVLLQTGRFDAAAAEATRFALAGFAFGMVGHVALEVVARAFYARRDTTRPLWMAVVALVVNVLGALSLVRFFALGGLALANSLAVLAEVALGLWWLRGVFDAVHARALWAVVWRCVTASAVLSLAVWSVLRLPVLAPLLGQAGGLGAATTLALGGSVGALAYLFASLVLGLRLSRAGLTVRSEPRWSA